jgi:uncharacterized membrane protein (DUF4010 family)
VNAIEWTFQLRLAVALALGFLTGLERESVKAEHQKLVFGGVRTHPIISLFGFGCAWLFQMGATVMLPVGLLSVGILAAVAYSAKIRAERFGSTTEFSALLTFVVGALALLADIWVSMALGIINAILLSEKAKLETFVENLNKAEFLATLKFLLVTLIILPVLPDQPYTRFGINPSTVWKMVIIVSTVGFVGYVLTRRLGARVGLWLSGLLGGIVSSTAVTIATGRMAQRDPGRALAALQASILASSVMYIRILVIVAIVSPSHVGIIWWKLGVLALAGVLLALFLKGSGGQTEPQEESGVQNPFELTPALLFALLFVALSVTTTLVRSSAGDVGILTLSALVGVIDVDPFIVSLIQGADVSVTIVTNGILIAMMSNTLAKGFYFGVLARTVRRETGWRYVVWALFHVPLILFG